MKISIILVAITFILAINSTSSELVPSQNGRPNLLKRSLCNTFGGCGAKRSLQPPFNYRAVSEEANEARRYNKNEKLISEILGDIMEHLQKDQNYRQGKYVVFVPKQTSDGTKYLQQLDAVPNHGQQIAPDVRESDEEFANV